MPARRETEPPLIDIALSVRQRLAQISTILAPPVCQALPILTNCETGRVSRGGFYRVAWFPRDGMSSCGHHYPRQESDTRDAGRRGWLTHRF